MSYDGDGRRIIKTVGNSATYFLYDASGKLLTEASAATAFGNDYLYLRDEPVARVDWTSEVDLGNYLKGNKNSPNVRLDWLSFPSASNVYVVRRKQVVNSADKTFNGNAVIATLNDPTEIYDDPVLNDGNRYDYQVTRKVSGDTLLFYHTDNLGTPIALTDGTGSPVWRAEYRPFGDGTPTGTSVSNLRLPGQYFDGETGLHQNWFRDYGPKIGRFLSADPVDYHNGISLYAYAMNRPTILVDPSGLIVCAKDCPPEVKQAKRDLCDYANTIQDASIRQCIGKKCRGLGNISCNQGDPDCRGGSPAQTKTTTLMVLCAQNPMPPGACWKRVIAHEMWIHQCRPGGPAEPDPRVHERKREIIKQLVPCP